MPSFDFRLLLDHAAENGYGSPGLQRQTILKSRCKSILESGHETDKPVHPAGLPRRPSVTPARLLRHRFWAAVKTYPASRW